MPNIAAGMFPADDEEEKRRARQRAQRRLARQLKTGTFERSPESRASAAAHKRRNTPVYQRSLKPINVVAQVGNTIELAEVSGMDRGERRKVFDHWMLIRDYLQAGSGDWAEIVPQTVKQRKEDRREISRLERKIKSYAGKRTGGVPSVEFASDPDEIATKFQTDSETFNFNQIYPVSKR